MAKKPKSPKTIEALKHDEATRKNIPTAEYQSLMQKEDSAPVRVEYPRGKNGLDEEKAQRNRTVFAQRRLRPAERLAPAPSRWWRRVDRRSDVRVRPR